MGFVRPRSSARIACATGLGVALACGVPTTTLAAAPQATAAKPVVPRKPATTAKPVTTAKPAPTPKPLTATATPHTNPPLPPLPPPATATAKADVTKKKTAAWRPPVVSARYQGAVKTWHSATPGHEAKTDAKGRAMLTLFAINTGEEVSLTAGSEEGAFPARELERAAHVLREPSSGNEHPVEPRELDLLYAIQRHFAAPSIRVISGYRTPHGGHSNHGRGRAVDLVVPGVSDEEVAKFARTLGFVGVGIYPHSGFVHVDVRDRSYFWVDASGPGKKNRERGILGALASESDKAAIARGVRPMRPFVVAKHVDANAVETAPADPPMPADEDDDLDGDGDG
ncbi:MAG: DUF882 domain-containing protein [Polyangiaceae bacterium]